MSRILQVQVDYFRVDVEGGFSMPRMIMRDRRNQRNSARPVHWVFQRHLEMILYNRWDGGTSGAVYKLLHATGLNRTSFNIGKAQVQAKEVTQGEFSELVGIFRTSHPNWDVDHLGAVRNVTLIPLATAAAMARTFGHSANSMAFLAAFSQSVPRAWELQERREELAERQQVDLALEAELEAAPAELEEHMDKSFAEELLEMAAFTADREDEQSMKQYALKEPSVQLLEDFDTYVQYRTEAFEARRSGTSVVSATAQHDTQGVLRFFGFLSKSKLARSDVLHLQLLAAAKLGDWVQAYTRWLRDTQKLKCSSIANYLNSLAMVTQYVYESGGFVLSEAVTSMEQTPLTMIVNLRDQAEKESKTEKLYTQRVGGFIAWEEAQQARVRAVEALATCQVASEKQELLKGATAMALLTLIPPDRVGVIRKLRVGHTLRRTVEPPSEEGADPVVSWGIDLSKQRNAHKTSKFYGPYAAKLPPETWPLITSYVDSLAFEMGGEQAYLFHPKTLGVGRPMESTQWTSYVRQLFGKWHGSEVPPKALRSSFITFLRDSTAAPEVLKSAAHAMKHRPEMQASEHYDANADGRLVQAAFEFNSTFAAKFQSSIPLPTPAPPRASDDADAAPPPPGWIGDVVAKRGATQGDDLVVFTATIPYSSALQEGRVIVFPKVPTRSTPFKVTLRGDESALRNGVKINLHLRRSFRPSSTKLKGVHVTIPDEEEPDEEEEEEEDPRAENQFRIERVLDARRVKRRKLELFVKWSGVDEHGKPWPNDWIPATWATPSARRDGERILREGRLQASRWQQVLEETAEEGGGEAEDDGDSSMHDTHLVHDDDEEDSEEDASPNAPPGGAGSSAAHAALPPPPSSPMKRTRTARQPAPEEALEEASEEAVVDEMDVSGLAVGQSVLARTTGPMGQKQWFRATIKAFRSQWPPVVVKFTATEGGNTTRLMLPEPLTGFVWKGNLKPLTTA